MGALYTNVFLTSFDVNGESIPFPTLSLPPCLTPDQPRELGTIDPKEAMENFDSYHGLAESRFSAQFLGDL